MPAPGPYPRSGEVEIRERTSTLLALVLRNVAIASSGRVGMKDRPRLLSLGWVGNTSKIAEVRGVLEISRYSSSPFVKHGARWTRSPSSSTVRGVEKVLSPYRFNSFNSLAAGESTKKLQML